MDTEPGQFLFSEGSDLGLLPLFWQDGGLVYLRLLSIFVDIDQQLNNYWRGRSGQTDRQTDDMDLLRNLAKITLNLENDKSFLPLQILPSQPTECSQRTRLIPAHHSHGEVVNESPFGDLHVEHDGLGPLGIVHHLGLDHGVGQPGGDGGLNLVAVKAYLVIILHLHLTKSLYKFRAPLGKNALEDNINHFCCLSAIF